MNLKAKDKTTCEIALDCSVCLPAREIAVKTCLKKDRNQKWVRLEDAEAALKEKEAEIQKVHENAIVQLKAIRNVRKELVQAQSDEIQRLDKKLEAAREIFEQRPKLGNYPERASKKELRRFAEEIPEWADQLEKVLNPSKEAPEK